MAKEKGATGCCHGQGFGCVGSGRSAAVEKESSQVAQMCPAEGGREMQRSGSASCLKHLALMERKVPRCFSTMIPSPDGTERGRGLL